MQEGGSAATGRVRLKTNSSCSALLFVLLLTFFSSTSATVVFTVHLMTSAGGFNRLYRRKMHLLESASLHVGLRGD